MLCNKRNTVSKVSHNLWRPIKEGEGQLNVIITISGTTKVFFIWEWVLLQILERWGQLALEPGQLEPSSQMGARSWGALRESNCQKQTNHCIVWQEFSRDWPTPSTRWRISATWWSKWSKPKGSARPTLGARVIHLQSWRWRIFFLLLSKIQEYFFLLWSKIQEYFSCSDPRYDLSRWWITEWPPTLSTRPWRRFGRKFSLCKSTEDQTTLFPFQRCAGYPRCPWGHCVRRGQGSQIWVSWQGWYYSENFFSTPPPTQIMVPLLWIKNGERKWIRLKDKSLRKRAKGEEPQILLEMNVFWNPWVQNSLIKISIFPFSGFGLP